MSKRPSRNESGQALIEYIILLSIVVGVIALLLPKLSQGFDVATVALGGKMETQLRTGKAPPSIWTK